MMAHVFIFVLGLLGGLFLALVGLAIATRGAQKESREAFVMTDEGEVKHVGTLDDILSPGRISRRELYERANASN